MKRCWHWATPISTSRKNNRKQKRSHGVKTKSITTRWSHHGGGVAISFQYIGSQFRMDNRTFVSIENIIYEVTCSTLYVMRTNTRLHRSHTFSEWNILAIHMVYCLREATRIPDWTLEMDFCLATTGEFDPGFLLNVPRVRSPTIENGSRKSSRWWDDWDRRPDDELENREKSSESLEKINWKRGKWKLTQRKNDLRVKRCIAMFIYSHDVDEDVDPSSGELRQAWCLLLRICRNVLRLCF
jgi:hypothetical protein